MRIIFLFAFCFTALASTGQKKAAKEPGKAPKRTDPVSAFERNAKGMCKKETSAVGSLQGIDVNTITVTDLVSERIIKIVNLSFLSPQVSGNDAAELYPAVSA